MGVESQWYKNVFKNPEVRYTVGGFECAGRVEQLPINIAIKELKDYGVRHPTAIRILNRFVLGEKFENSSTQYQVLAAQVPVLQLAPKNDATYTGR